MKQKNGGWIALFLAPACILFILIFAIPLVMVFVTSLFDYRLLPRTFTFVGFSNFVQLFTEDNRFWPIFGNTVKWLFIHCIFHVTLGTLLAFILYKKPRGWKFVRVTYMIPNIISQSAIAMIFLNLYNAQYGAVNSFLKLVGLEITAQLVVRDGNCVPVRHFDLVPVRRIHHHVGPGSVVEHG